MRIYTRNGTPNWWATWYGKDGKRHRRSTGTSDKRLAEVLTAEWAQESFLEEHFGKKPELPFEDALLSYAKTQKRDSKHFMDKTRYRLLFLSKRFPNWNVRDFTYGAMQTFVDERMETVSSAMAQRDLALVKAIINKARKEGRTDFAPNFPKLKGSKPRVRWLTEEEVERLADCAAPHLKPLILFAADTGGRRSELFNLDWRYVDLERGRITFVDTKNGDDRTVRLCERAVRTLQDLGPKENGPVFTYFGRSIGDIKHAFDTARTRAGIEDFRFHDLRHTFASRLVQGGVPLYSVMGLTGHKSLEMVQRYAHLSPDYQEDAIRVLDSRTKNHWHDLGTEKPLTKCASG